LSAEESRAFYLRKFAMTVKEYYFNLAEVAWRLNLRIGIFRCKNFLRVRRFFLFFSNWALFARKVFYSLAFE